MGIVALFLASCSTWKNHTVPLSQQENYAYQGDTLDSWSLVRLDSMGGMWGYVSADGRKAIEPVFDWADDFADGAALVQYQGHYSYLNLQGKRMRRIKGVHAYAFSEGLAAVQKGDKWGYIDRGGKWVIKPQFDWALPFAQKRAAVAIGNQYGFIDTQGKLVIAAQYDYTKPFANGLSIVQKNGKYGLIDTLGHEVLPMQYRYIEPWKNGTYKLHAAHKKTGLANPQGTVMLDTVYTYMGVEREHFLRVKRNQLWGLVDFNGREILSTTYSLLGFVSDEGFLVAEKDDKYGVVDTTGKTVLPFIYDGTQQLQFSEGRICLMKDGKMLLMDKQFRVIRELPYDGCDHFYHGFAYVMKKKQEAGGYVRQSGYINLDGEEVIPPQYHFAYIFNTHGLTIASTRIDGISNWFVIDTTGARRTTHIPENHPGHALHHLQPFGKRLFYNDSGGKSLAFLSSETGRFLPDMPYTAFSPIEYSDRDDLAKIYIGSRVGLMDTTLTEILPVQFEDIGVYTHNLIAVKQSGKWGFADQKFRFRIPFIYDKVSSFRYGYAEADTNKRKSIIDPKGRTIVPLHYKETTVDSISRRIYAQKEDGTDIYDMYGRLLFQSDYAVIFGYWGDNYSKFYTNLPQGKMGILDKNFRVTCEPIYDFIGSFYEGRARVVNDKRGGFLDSTFQLAIPIEYEWAEDFACGFTKVKKDGESFYIDIHGNRVDPSEDDIAKREDVIEQRKKGFIDFSS